MLPAGFGQKRQGFEEVARSSRDLATLADNLTEKLRFFRL